MTITTLIKQVDRQPHTICGHLNHAEIAEYKSQGYRFGNVNKHGIEVCGKGGRG